MVNLQQLRKFSSMLLAANAIPQRYAGAHGNSRRCIVVGGPSGCGKSTAGTAVARSLCCAFLDADAYHPQINIDKMRAGLALTDADRWPWLETLADVIDQHLSAGQDLVLACSALKESYRQKLRGKHSNALLFVLLKPSREELLRRVQARAALGVHFMPPALLDSQLSVLETEGPGVLTLEGDWTATECTEKILQYIAAT